MDSLILSQIPVLELATIISNEVKKHFLTSTEVKDKPKEENEIYYTRKEVCSLFHISLVTLHKHTKTKRLNAHRIGARVLYKRSEVLKALSTIK